MATAFVIGRDRPPGASLAATLADRHGMPSAPAGEADVVVCAPGTPTETRRHALAGARRRGRPYVDAAWQADWVEEVLGTAGPGPAIVVGCALSPAVGVALAEVAAAGRRRVTDVHCAYAFPDGGGVRALVAGDEPAASLGRPHRSLVAGDRREEWPAEARRLAWFPRPYGPRHAVGVPGAEPALATPSLPSALTVRTYLAMPGWRAELAQALARLAARPAVAARLARRLDRPPPASDPRWACVVEAAGPDGVVRAWANGRRPVDVGVAAAALSAATVAGGDRPPPDGVLPPSTAVGATTLLDHLAAVTGLRWSVVRPDPDGPGAGDTT